LLRPWAERNQPFSFSSDSSVLFPFSRRVFIDGHACQLDFVTETNGNGPGLRWQFQDPPPALGDLTINGQYIERMVFSGGPYMVILNQPKNQVKVPAGTYGQTSILLKNGGSQASRSAPSRLINIDARRPNSLTVGGPLTNAISVVRNGAVLSLGYRLVGAGGETYQLTSQDRLHPPEFVVYKGDRKIASGKFEFG